MVLVHIRDSGMVLGEEGEDDGSRAGGEVVDAEQGEGPDDDYEEKWREKNGIR